MNSAMQRAFDGHLNQYTDLLGEVARYVKDCIYFGDEPDLDEFCRILGISREDYEQR